MSASSFFSKSAIKASVWLSAITGGLLAASLIAPVALSQESEMRQVESFTSPELTAPDSTADSAAAIALTIVGGGAIGLAIHAAQKRQRFDASMTFAPNKSKSGQSPTSGEWHRANRSLQRKLLLLLHEDHHAAERLVQQASFRYPGKSPDWYLEKVIYDLQRDRGIAG
jgi:hypothetical protein